VYNGGQSEPFEKRGPNIMNRIQIPRTGIAVIAASILTGCAAKTAPEMAVQPVAQRPYVIAVRYEVEPALRRPGFDWGAELTDDLTHIRTLGFDTVEATWLTDEQVARLLPAAHEQELAVVTASRKLQDFITQIQSTDLGTDEVRPPRVEWAQHHALRALVLIDHPVVSLLPTLEATMQAVRPTLAEGAEFWVGADAATLETAAQMNGAAVVWRGRVIRDVLAEAATIVGEHRRIVQLELPWEGALADETRRVIAARSSAWVALAGGWTDGVVVSRYRSWAGRDNGLVETDQSMNRRDTAGVRKWLKQVRLFGTRVKGAQAMADASVVWNGDESLSVAALSRGALRWLLVYNTDTERVAAGSIQMPDTWLTKPVTRVVNVQSLQRFEPNEGTATIPVRIAPGEAILFEAF
jgi:hypothetical protein